MSLSNGIGHVRIASRCLAALVVCSCDISLSNGTVRVCEEFLGNEMKGRHF